jgi:hypothetical protein
MSRYSSKNGKVVIDFRKNSVTFYKSKFHKMGQVKEIENPSLSNLLVSLLLFEDYFKVENLERWNSKEGDEYLDIRIFFEEKLVHICSHESPSYEETINMLLNELYE